MTIVRTLLAWGATAMVSLALCGVARAQANDSDAATASEADRLDRLESSLESVIAENQRLSEELRVLNESISQPLEDQESNDWITAEAPPKPRAGFLASYKNGFVILPDDMNSAPFSMKINNQNTCRYTGFSRDEDTWTDSAGNVLPIFNSSAFNIPRGRLIFSGNALLPNLSYLLNIDYNTVSNNPIGFRAYAWSYRFGRGLEVSIGQNKVPGSREWLASSFDSQEGPDRSMATTFFRPSLSQGVWFTGEPLEGLYYHAMVSNGFNTLNLRPNQFDNRMCFSDSVWWEPRGEFGRGYSDLEDHQHMVVRMGGSFTYAIEAGSQSSDYPENSAVRLSDGTLLTQQGALAPGVTLQSFDLSLAAIDVAIKHRGFSLAAEMYFQELSSLQGNGPLPISSTHAHGGFLQGGCFIVPQTVELYARTSYVSGDFGSGTEIAGGLNWFIIPGKSNLRYTFDAASLDSSPADQGRTGFVAGQTGLLIRTQLTSWF